MNRVYSDVIGKHVAGFEVLGRAENGSNQWIGADLELRIPPLGRFALTIVTKAQYVTDNLRETLEAADRVERYFGDGEPIEAREPFVLNDDNLSMELLERKFLDRRVEEDLAVSLWFVTN